MALAKESESFDEYSIEKRGSSVRLEKQIGEFRRPSPFYSVMERAPESSDACRPIPVFLLLRGDGFL